MWHIYIFILFPLLGRRISRLIWIGHANRMDSKRKACKVFNSNLQGSRLRVRPKSRWWKRVQIFNKCKITNWKER